LHHEQRLYSLGGAIDPLIIRSPIYSKLVGCVNI
jgi:hypothetical protein